MEIIDDQKLTLEVDGQEKEFDVLFTFTSEDTGKAYIGYTDNSTTKDGRKNVYYSSYDPLFGPEKLEKVTSPSEVEMIRDVLQEIDRSARDVWWYI